MAYNVTIWKDHAVTPAHTFSVTKNSDGTITLSPAGTVVQQGTNMSAANFNNMEEGISAAGIGGQRLYALSSCCRTMWRACRALSLKRRLQTPIHTHSTTARQQFPFLRKTPVGTQIIMLSTKLRSTRATT